jgi:hypothetical protein
MAFSGFATLRANTPTSSRDAFYAVLLTFLYKFVPMMLRILARWEGTTQRTRVELSIMDWDFVFKIIVRVSHVVLYKRFLHV